jgi:septal ring factor EnvC (AmiA/AmiB activator)
MALRWNGEIGPTFILAALGGTVGAISAVWFSATLLTKIQSGVDLAEKNWNTLSITVQKQVDKQTSTTERLIKVETNLDTITKTVTRIDDKLDKIKDAKP